MLKLALAAAAVFVLIGLLVHGHDATAPDRIAYDILDPIEAKPVRDVVRVFTDVGSFPVVIVVGLIAAAYAATHERPRTAAALVAGAVLVPLLVPIVKDLWDRPRPRDAYYQPGGSSFPSGHSAQSIIWIAAAHALQRRPLIIAAVALAAAIGLSRLYLHVHYLTDVLGGFALGVALLAPSMAIRR